jgi:NADH-quinone oxidoreductase subunit E
MSTTQRSQRHPRQGDHRALPAARSATIPLLHLSQEQDGYLTQDAMSHIAELVGATPAEVLGTATFYEMFKFEPVGKYLVNICGTMSCQLIGAEELMHHAEHRSA